MFSNSTYVSGWWNIFRHIHNHLPAFQFWKIKFHCKVQWSSKSTHTCTFKREIMWILNLCQAGDWQHLKMVLLFSSKIHTAAFSLMWPPSDLPSELCRYWRLHHPFNPWPLCWGSQCTCKGIFSEMDTSCRDQTDNTERWSFCNNFERFLVCVK